MCLLIQYGRNSGTKNVPRDRSIWVDNREEGGMKDVHLKNGHEK